MALGQVSIFDNIADGAGWSTAIPNYNPIDVVDNLKRMMNGEEPEKMNPWFRGFKVGHRRSLLLIDRDQSNASSKTNIRLAVFLKRSTTTLSRSPNCRSGSGHRTSRRCWRNLRLGQIRSRRQSKLSPHCDGGSWFRTTKSITQTRRSTSRFI